MLHTTGETTITLTAAQAQVIETALKHYSTLLDRVEEAAEELDSAGFSAFYTDGENKRYKTERLNISLLKRKLDA